MNLILREISTVQNWENQFNHYARKNILNSLSSKLINQSNFENFQNFIQSIVEKGPRKSKKRWVSNQRRILHILLNCISVISNLPVREFKNPEILKVHRVFSYKDRYSIEYEMRKLSTNNKQNRRRWSSKQENALEDIVKKTQNKNKWNEIARQLFIYSKGEYFRQGKHCRQRFYKLKDGKGQSSLSGEIASDENSEHSNSLQFHSQNNHSSENQEGKRQEIQQKFKKLDFRKISVSNQVDQICKNQKSQTPAGLVENSRLKAAMPFKLEQEKLRSTRDSFQEENNLSQGSDHNNNVEDKLPIEKQELAMHYTEQKHEAKVQQKLEEQNSGNNEVLGQGMFINGMGYNSMDVDMIVRQLGGGNPTIDPRWINMMRYWPLGGFSYNFPGYY